MGGGAYLHLHHQDKYIDQARQFIPLVEVPVLKYFLMRNSAMGFVVYVTRTVVINTTGLLPSGDS